jgi:hypothetical protein
MFSLTVPSYDLGLIRSEASHQLVPVLATGCCLHHRVNATGLSYSWSFTALELFASKGSRVSVLTSVSDRPSRHRSTLNLHTGESSAVLAFSDLGPLPAHLRRAELPHRKRPELA